MSSGGARSRSGPLPSERSARSNRRGYKLSTLPAEGYSGPVPNFPLPEPSPRETEVWGQVWRLPQGCLWSAPGYEWLLLTIGLYVRQFVKCEDRMAGGTQLAQLHRFADQVGMSVTGLALHGFKVAESKASESAAKAHPRLTALERARQRHEGRLRPVGDGDAP